MKEKRIYMCDVYSEIDKIRNQYHSMWDSKVWDAIEYARKQKPPLKFYHISLLLESVFGITDDDGNPYSNDKLYRLWYIYKKRNKKI